MAELLKPPRVAHTPSGWVIETTFDLKPSEVRACVVYTQRDLMRRIPRMDPGQKRDDAARALLTLDAGTIKQVIRARYPWEQDRIICSDRGAPT